MKKKTTTFTYVLHINLLHIQFLSYCKTIFLKRLGYKFTREWPKTLIHKCDRFCSRQLMVLSDKIVQDMAKKEFKSVLAFDNDFHHESTMWHHFIGINNYNWKSYVTLFPQTITILLYFTSQLWKQNVLYADAKQKISRSICVLISENFYDICLFLNVPTIFIFFNRYTTLPFIDILFGNWIYLSCQYLLQHPSWNLIHIWKVTRHLPNRD